MSGGSVWDRFREAEVLQGDNKQDGSPTFRRGQKLTLKTDELIKEEFLRRGDGGWSKNVDIGQRQPFVAPPPRTFIKVTAETPLTRTAQFRLPGRLIDKIPGKFEPDPALDIPQRKASRSILADQRFVEKEAKEWAAARNIPVERFLDLLDKEPQPMVVLEGNNLDQRQGINHHQAYVEVQESTSREISDIDEALSPRETVLFDPIEWDERQAAKQERRESRKSRQRTDSGTDIVGKDCFEERHPTRSRSRRLRSERRHYHGEGYLDEAVPLQYSHRRHKCSSRSRCRHENSPKAEPQDEETRHQRRSSRYHTRCEEPPLFPTENYQVPSHSLWPSFSNTKRRSMSDISGTTSVANIAIFSTSIRHRSGGSRTRSELSDADTELLSRKLEFAEFVTGKKLDYIPPAPSAVRPGSTPIGYVRSKSSSGAYTEFYTRERRLLREPSEDEIVPSIDHPRGRKERQSSSSDMLDRERPEPWQVKLFQTIARKS